jgi:hypothetical protein
MLNSEGGNYTDEEVSLIHNFFYQLIDIEIENYKAAKEKYLESLE